MESKNDKLAIHGGERVIKYKFNQYNPIGSEEVRVAKEVIESGVLSQYLGAWGHQFYGGPKVLEFEEKCSNYFQVKNAITVNSWTSGLIAAVGAIGTEPGDEIIVTTFTMCASATAIVHWNAIPVFADIEEDTFCLSPESIEKNITENTKAIMVVDIFGQSADMISIMEIAKKHNLKVISDTAQAPGAVYNGSFAGTLADIGGYSLNYHKHIHTGEGGILVTNDDVLAEKLRLIRNHAEAVVEAKGCEDLANMVGYNFRLGEIECAMGISQLNKLGDIIKKRQYLANLLNQGLCDLKGIKLPTVRSGATHVYYVYAVNLDLNLIKIPRRVIVDALRAEGIDALSEGYVNVHMLPMYQKKIAYGAQGFPWIGTKFNRDLSYKKGICPTAELFHDKSLICFQMCAYDINEEDIELIIKAFHKVWDNLIN